MRNRLSRYTNVLFVTGIIWALVLVGVGSAVAMQEQEVFRLVSIRCGVGSRSEYRTRSGVKLYRITTPYGSEEQARKAYEMRLASAGRIVERDHVLDERSGLTGERAVLILTDKAVVIERRGRSLIFIEAPSLEEALKLEDCIKRINEKLNAHRRPTNR